MTAAISCEPSAPSGLILRWVGRLERLTRVWAFKVTDSAHRPRRSPTGRLKSRDLRGALLPRAGRPTIVANIQVVRIERRPQLGGPLLAHIDGRRRPAEAKTREGMPACIKIAGDVEAARQALKAAQAVKRPGPKPAPVVEGLFAGVGELEEVIISEVPSTGCGRPC